jgi:hypothetical protein
MQEAMPAHMLFLWHRKQSVDRVAWKGRVEGLNESRFQLQCTVI